jgi:hypothetical protein
VELAPAFVSFNNKKNDFFTNSSGCPGLRQGCDARSGIVLWKYGRQKSSIFGQKTQKSYSTSGAYTLLDPHRFQITIVSLVRFDYKNNFFLF